MTLGLSGGIMQIAYVVENLDSAIEHWARRLGVGPFFVRPHVEFSEFRYRNLPSSPDISLAFAYSGETQIELIEVHDGAPSVFQAFRRAHGYGLQHVGILSGDLEGDVGRLAGAGVLPVQRSRNARGIETIMFDTEIHPGSMLELIEASPPLLDGFAKMKAAAADWDGKDSRRE